MNEVIKVKIEPIYLGDFCIEVMQKPKGDYSLSKTDIADIVGEERQSFSNFLDGESDLALPFKGISFPSAKVPGKKGALPDAVPIPIAIAYWRYCDRRGNVKASAIIAACIQETIERRADIAFGILRSEDDRNKRFAATVENFVLNKAKPWDTTIDGTKPFIMEFYSDNWSRFLTNVQIGIPSGSVQAIQMELEFLMEIEEDCARRLEEDD